MSYKLVALGDVCTVKRGTTITQKSATHGEIPVVAGGLKPTYFHNVSNRDGNVITISGSGANAGFVNYWNQPIFASDCSTVQTKRDDFSINYAYYFLLSKQDYIYKNLRSGAAQPHVYGKDIANLEIPMLPLATQEKIVTRLDAIFNEIDKAIALTEVNLNNVETLFHRHTNYIFLELKKIYSVVKIDDICSSVEYGTSSKSQKIGAAPVLRMGNIIDGELDYSDLVFTDDVQEIAKYKLCDGDVLFNRTNSPLHVGKSAVFRGENIALFAGYLIKINYFKEKVLPDFLCYYLNSKDVRDYGYSVMSVSVNQANINGSKLKNYPFTLPPINEQRLAVEKIDNMKNYCNSLKKEFKLKINSLNILKNAILQQAFNGDLVKD